MTQDQRHHIKELPTVKVEMLIRRPAHEVFAALVDPAITTKIWFTKSSGKLEPGARVRWDWEMYGVHTYVTVKKIEKDRCIRIVWHEDDPTTVEWNFAPQPGGRTFVTITETGFKGDADKAIAHVIDSTGGFTFLISALKAYLEHGIMLNIVADHSPKAP